MVNQTPDKSSPGQNSGMNVHGGKLMGELLFPPPAKIVEKLLSWGKLLSIYLVNEEASSTSNTDPQYGYTTIKQ